MAIRIHHLSGSRQGESQVFKGKSISLGRRRGKDVLFHPNEDRAVSVDHAVVAFDGTGWTYKDMGSSGGSWIRGERVSEVALSGGEEIQLGQGGPVIRFELVNDAEVSPKTDVVPVATLPGGKSSAQTADSGAEVIPPTAVRGKDRTGPVGSKTVGMMIQAAFQKSRSQATGRVATLAFVRSVAGEAVRHGSRRFKIVVAAVFVILAGTVVFLILELQRTRAELKDIHLSKMGPSEIGEWIADQNRATIFLLLYQTRVGFEQGFCTGFAVSQSQLLTNAHCVMQMKKLAGEGAVFYAAPNEGSGARYRVTGWSAHTGYNPSSPTPTADVGIVTVEGAVQRIVILAEAEHVQALKSGSQIFVFGFPGDLSNVGSPVATITNGVIGRLTALDGQAAPPERQHLLQYSAFTSKGTSGSPVFDKYGRVIAVNSGYYQGKSRVKIENPLTGKSEDANVSRDLSGYAFGIRIDLAKEVLK